MRILVTGGAGFIGSHVVETYQGVAEEIRVLDDLETGKLSNLLGFDQTFIRGTITDRRTVEEAVEGIDLVYHCAALASVPECSAAPEKCQEVNIRGLKNVLRAAARSKVKNFVFLSSSAVYGPKPSLPTKETHTLSPISAYAASKVQGEILVHQYGERSSMRTNSFRLFNVFGPRQNPEGGYSAAIPTFISRALSNEVIRIHGSGRQTRDFVYVSDVIQAIGRTLTAPSFSDPLNIGTGVPISVNDLVHQIKMLTNSSSPVLHEDKRADDAEHSCADVNRVLGLGWKPAASLEEGLNKTIAWQKSCDHSSVGKIEQFG